MLFYGPPGTGKTSTILALCQQLFGPTLAKSRVLELNASDERGISIVRDKIKNFARTQLSNVPPGVADKYPCPPFRIIVLDEADSMTQDAQSALRRTMETYAKVTRFCLICNYVTRIIDPLASRCSKFRFKSLGGEDARGRVADIAKLEGVKMEGGVVDVIIRCSEGDLRKAITFLQSAARLVGAQNESGNGGGNTGGSKKKKKIIQDNDDDDDVMDIDHVEKDGDKGGVVTIKSVEEIAGVVPRETITNLIEAMKRNVYTNIAKQVEDLVAEGWSATQLISQLYEIIIYSEDIPDRQKNRIVSSFSDTDKRLVDGADEHLTILDLCLQIATALAS